MKLLHLADLHLGKRVCEYPIIEDQRVILREITEIAVREGVRAVLVAGDVYDHPMPPAEAVTLFSDFLTSLSEAGVEVYLIAGNHDSGERLSFARALMRRAGIHILGEGVRAETVRVGEGADAVSLTAVPYLHTAVVRAALPEARIETAADAMRAVLAAAPREEGVPRVLLAHAFVTGSTVCESDFSAVGTAEAIPAGVFAGYDYVALGHLHGAQEPAKGLCYAGSPLAYSFSEVAQRKSVTVVDITPDGVKKTRFSLHAPHPMREVRGTLAELMESDYSEDYIRAVVTDEEVPPDARVTLRAVFPNLMRFAVENSRTHVEESTEPLENVEARAPIDLFAEFYENQTGAAPDETRLAVMREIFGKGEEDA